MRTIIFLICFFPVTILGQEAHFAWQEFSIGDPALTIMIPGEPKPQEIPLPDHILSVMRRYDAYIVENETKNIAVIISHVAYTDEVKADLQGAAEGTISEWKLNGAKVDIINTSKEMISGKTSLRQSGLLDTETGHLKFSNTIIVEGSMLWQLLVVMNAEDPTLQLVLQHILDSITFNDSEK